MSSRIEQASLRWHRSPLAFVLLVVNAVCFGALLVLLIVAAAPVAILTVCTGVLTASGLAGVLYARRRRLAP